jgi:hypothetical protein
MPDAKSYDNRSLPLEGLSVERVFAAQFDGFGLELRDAASDETRQGELSLLALSSMPRRLRCRLSRGYSAAS